MAYGDGREFARIDLGAIGELVIMDDGDNDAYVNTHIETPDGRRHGVSTGIVHFRKERGDTVLEEELSNAVSGSTPTQTTPRRHGPFVCNDCCLTCPSSWESEAGSGVCHDCAEDGR